MFGLTPLGVLHTAISLLAVAAGLIALVRYKQIVRVVTAALFIAATLQVRWLRAQCPQQA
jgi:hypothetical protein